MTLVAIVGQVVISHINLIAGWPESIGGWAIVHLFGVGPCWVLTLLDRLLFWYLLLMALSFVLPNPTGPKLRANLLALTWKLIRVATHLAKIALLWLFKFITGLLKRN